MQIIQRLHVKASGLLARAHEFRKQLWKVETKHVERRRIIVDVDLGLEGKELRGGSDDRGRGMHKGIMLKGHPGDRALLGAQALPAAEFSEWRVVVPQPAVDVVRQGNFEVTEA